MTHAPTFPDLVTFPVPIGAFTRALSAVATSMSPDETRPHLNAVRVEVSRLPFPVDGKNLNVRLVATDGHRLVTFDLPVLCESLAVLDASACLAWMIPAARVEQLKGALAPFRRAVLCPLDKGAVVDGSHLRFSFDPFAAGAHAQSSCVLSFGVATETIPAWGGHTDFPPYAEHMPKAVNLYENLGFFSVASNYLAEVCMMFRAGYAACLEHAEEVSRLTTPKQRKALRLRLREAAPMASPHLVIQSTGDPLAPIVFSSPQVPGLRVLQMPVRTDGHLIGRAVPVQVGEDLDPENRESDIRRQVRAREKRAARMVLVEGGKSASKGARS